MKRLTAKRKIVLPTPAELRLLKALWALGEGTVEQVVSSFPEAEQPNYKTTHTFLRIMETKGFIAHNTVGKLFIFRPLVSESEVAKASVSNLLTQSFGGSARGLFINLLESGNLKANELREIEALIIKHRKAEETQ